MANDVQRLTYTVQETATVLGCSRTKVYDGIHEGTIPAIWLGERKVVVPRAALEKMLGITDGKGGLLDDRC